MTTATKRSTRRNGAKPVKARDICLLGYAEETRDLVFGLPEDTEIWGINAAHFFTHKKKGDAWEQRESLRAKVTDWFQMHPSNWVGVNKKATGYWGRPVEHFDFLKSFEGNVWMLYPEDGPARDIPNRKRYPIEQIIAACGRNHFTSSFAYQMGMVWYQHVVEKNPVERLRLYGINLTSMDEYIHQKSCVEYWIGRLDEAGVQVEVPTASALLKGKQYATGADMADHVFERLQHAKEKYMEANSNLTTGLAIKQDVKFWAGQLGALAEEHPQLLEEPLKSKIQSIIDQRMTFVNGLTERSAAELNGFQGQVKTEQHYLAQFGGIDHRSGALPQPRLPSEALAQAVEMPKQQSI